MNNKIDNINIINTDFWLLKLDYIFLKTNFLAHIILNLFLSKYKFHIFNIRGIFQLISLFIFLFEN
jgi:hypothetical protein